MRYQLLGKSGLRVSELCLGTMTFGEDWGWGADQATCQAMFDHFVNEGGNFIDTANLYTNGTSEKYVGEFIQSDREHFVVATKYSLIEQANNNDPRIRPNHSGNSRKNMLHTVEASLKRLKTDYIDVLYLHAWDYLTPVEEVMRAMDDLIRQGKVNYLAISDTPAWIISQANIMAELRGWTAFIGVQVPYSLIRRDIEIAILPMAHHHQITLLPWGILSAGVLTGKFLRNHEQATRVDPASLNLTEKEINIVQEVVAIADELGRSPSQVAINWVRQQNHWTSIIPIIGARYLDQLKDNLACLEFELSEEYLKRLSDLSRPEARFPENFLKRNPFLFGNTFDQLDTADRYPYRT